MKEKIMFVKDLWYVHEEFEIERRFSKRSMRSFYFSSWIKDHFHIEIVTIILFSIYNYFFLIARRFLIMKEAVYEKTIPQGIEGLFIIFFHRNLLLKRIINENNMLTIWWTGLGAFERPKWKIRPVQYHVSVSEVRSGTGLWVCYHFLVI